MNARAEAKAAGLPRYYTGKPCKRGHVAERFASSARCVECNRLRDPEKVAARSRAYYAANREKEIGRSRARYTARREKENARCRTYQAENREKVRAQKRVYQAATLPAIAARSAKRRANKLRATPPWITQEQIRAMAGLYRFARIRKRLLGGDWHVDHIVPLQGANVCGLHVPWNLQVIRAEENIKKYNRLLGAA